MLCLLVENYVRVVSELSGGKEIYILLIHFCIIKNFYEMLKVIAIKKVYKVIQLKISQNMIIDDIVHSFIHLSIKEPFIKPP